MLITNLKEAEQVVKSNRELRWDGWDIISSHFNPRAYSQKDGAWDGKKWVIRKRYSPDRNGWTIPDKYNAGGKNG